MKHSHLLNDCLRRPPSRTAQRGVSLLFALMALAAMLLAAVALVRSVDSGALVLGNLGFKQEATRPPNRAAEVRALVEGLPRRSTLTVDSPALVTTPPRRTTSTRPVASRRRPTSWRSSIGAIRIAAPAAPRPRAVLRARVRPRLPDARLGTGDGALPDHPHCARRLAPWVRPMPAPSRRRPARPTPPTAARSGSAPARPSRRRPRHRITESSCAPSVGAAP